jgi:hypothetical protein
LNKILRYHEPPISDPGEQQIRQSFDRLLYFYGKLGYLLYVELLKEKEMRFFDYFLDKMLDEDIPKINDENAIIYYAKAFEFKLFALLLYQLKRLPPS